MSRNRMLLLLLTSLLLASLACSITGSSNDENAPTPEAASEEVSVEEADQPPPTDEPDPTSDQSTSEQEEPVSEPADDPTEYDSVFPLPPNVQNFTGKGGDSPVNFATDLSLDDAVEFYRQAFSDDGLTERQITTVINDTTFS
ncbi:MAG: hypothetical protein U9Q82_12595, partial [Chloroflexota bacterium]|nr:hypothetical protein [Chloroflexota bacterium]